MKGVLERGFLKVELLLNMTIGGTATACVILLVRSLLKNKLTPKLHIYLWIILAVRLMIPGLPESDFSLLNAVPAAQNLSMVENQVSGRTEEANSSVSRYVEGNLILKSPISGMEQKRTFSVSEQSMDLLLMGWLSGGILMAAYLAGAYGVFRRRIAKLPICNDVEILELFEECKGEVKITTDRIVLRCGGKTPMLQGILKPTILLPQGFSKEELRHVLIHELCHYKHKDVFINIICCLFLCVYWFNPVLWVCFYMVRRDLEILCDERVVEITGERKEYAMVLLKTAMRKNSFLFAATAMQNGEKEVEKRIKHIAYFKKPKVWILTLAIIAVITTGAICLTDASALTTVNQDVGNGYFMKIPESWIDKSHQNGDGLDLMFTNEEGVIFSGVSFFQVDLGANKSEGFEAAQLPLPSDAEVLGRKVIKENEYEMIIVNLDRELAISARVDEENASDNNSSNRKVNQNYIFLLPDDTKDEIYIIWANSSQVSERKLLKIARTLQKDPYPQGYQPEAAHQDHWDETADRLLRAYFKNYVDADMAISSDISGYQIDHVEQFEDQEASWSLIHPDTAVFRVDYTLDIAYPEHYSFPGGGFEIGPENKTKIYKDQLAVFQTVPFGTARFLGFVWMQDRAELGDDMAVLHTIDYADPVLRPEAMLQLKTPYIGNHSADGSIIRALPLSEYSRGLELHTKAEPYGLTVNYDMTELGDKVFESRPDRAMTDSSGWNPNPYIQAQLYKNSAVLLSLIDNCSTVEFRITGMSELGVPYTYSYQTDRETLAKELAQDPRKYTESLESFEEFFYNLELTQLRTIKISKIKGE